MTDSTGPKISSRAIRMSLRTPKNTVGRTNQPAFTPSGSRSPPAISRAFRDADPDVILHASDASP